MTNVVRLKLRNKTRAPTSLDDIDAALGQVLVELANQYGAYAVATVALVYVCEVIQHASSAKRPIEARWLKDCARRFESALREDPNA